MGRFVSTTAGAAGGGGLQANPTFSSVTADEIKINKDIYYGEDQQVGDKWVVIADERNWDPGGSAGSILFSYDFYNYDEICMRVTHGSGCSSGDVYVTFGVGSCSSFSCSTDYFNIVGQNSCGSFCECCNFYAARYQSNSCTALGGFVGSFFPMNVCNISNTIGYQITAYDSNCCCNIFTGHFRGDSGSWCQNAYSNFQSIVMDHSANKFCCTNLSPNFYYTIYGRLKPS